MKTELELYHADPSVMELGATALDEITEFTLLCESNGRRAFRAFTNKAEAEPMNVGLDFIGLGSCFDIALTNPTYHQVTYYRVAGEAVRFIIRSRAPYPDPPQPPAIPTGSNFPVTWYQFRILLDRIDLIVAGANFVFGKYRFEYSWRELAMIMTALTPPSKYTIVVDGNPATGRPILKISRPIDA